MRSGLNLGVERKGSTGGGTSSVVIVPETGSSFEKVIPKMVLERRTFAVNKPVDMCRTFSVTRAFAVNREADIGRAFSGAWRFAVDRSDEFGRVTSVVR
jgi:hypothetical protein